MGLFFSDCVSVKATVLRSCSFRLLVMTKAELCSHIQSFTLNRIHIKVPFSDSIVNLIALLQQQNQGKEVVHCCL